MKRLIACLGIVLLAGCSMATTYPFDAPPGRPAADLQQDQDACTAQASPGVGRQIVSGLFTAGLIATAFLTGWSGWGSLAFVGSGGYQPEVYQACMASRGYTHQDPVVTQAGTLEP